MISTLPGLALEPTYALRFPRRSRVGRFKGAQQPEPTNWYDLSGASPTGKAPHDVC